MKKIQLFGRYMAVALLLLPCAAWSAIEGSPVTTVAWISSYPEYGEGDVVVRLSNNGSLCNSGYFMKSSTPGFNTTLAFIMMAYKDGKSLTLHGHTDRMWAGSSSGSYCHIYNINLK